MKLFCPWHLLNIRLFFLLHGIYLIFHITWQHYDLLVFHRHLYYFTSANKDPLLTFISKCTCGGSESWSPCWNSSWLCSTGAVGSWTSGTVCCPPPMQAAGPGSGRGAAACRRRSWCTAIGQAEGTGWGWRRGCGCEAESHWGAASPWIPACTRRPKAGGAVRSGRRAARCWSDVWSRSSWSTHQVLSLVREKTQGCITWI